MCNGSTPDSDSVCGGSNPSSSANKKHHPFGWCFFIGREEEEEGFEPIRMQQSGGLLLAAGLDGGNTIIKSNPSSGHPPIWVVFFIGREEEEGFEPIRMQQSGGLLLAAGLDGGNTIIKSNPSSTRKPPKRAVFFIGRKPDQNEAVRSCASFPVALTFFCCLFIIDQGGIV